MVYLAKIYFVYLYLPISTIIMKKILFLISFLSIIFLASSCGDDDKQDKTLRQLYIDISDFTMYKGSSEGGTEVLFNNLKKKTLAEKYLPEVFIPNAYTNITLQFNDEKLTYIESRGQGGGIQIVSDYLIKGDSLFIKTTSASDNLKFVSLIDLNGNLYRRIGLVYYPNPEYSPDNEEQPKFKQEAYSVPVNLETALILAGYNSLEDLTNPEDTIIWCNVIYPFN